MKKTTYNEMYQKMYYRLDFEGNSVHAYHDKDGTYIVKSYDTKMLQIAANGSTIFNDQWYSVTTRRIQSIIARLLHDTCDFKYRTYLGKRGGLNVDRDNVYILVAGVANSKWEPIKGIIGMKYVLEDL